MLDEYSLSLLRNMESEFDGDDRLSSGSLFHDDDPEIFKGSFNEFFSDILRMAIDGGRSIM